MRKIILVLLLLVAIVAVLAACSHQAQVRKYNRQHVAPFR